MDRRLLLLTAALGVSASAAAQYEDAKSYLGGQVGVYLPSDSLIRDRLGNSTVSFGLGNVGSSIADAKKLNSTFDFITASKGDNKLFVGSLSLGLEKRLDKQLYSSTIPYVKVFGGPSYFDYGIETTSGRKSGKKFGLNYGAEVGLLFVNRVKLAARYNAFSKQDGLDFSGFVLSATFNVLGF